MAVSIPILVSPCLLSSWNWIGLIDDRINRGNLRINHLAIAFATNLLLFFKGHGTSSDLRNVTLVRD